MSSSTPRRSALRRALLPLRNPAFSAAAAGLWAIHLILGYPLSYLVVPDGDIWLAQIGTWIFIAGESVLLGLAAGWLLEGIQELLSRMPVPRHFENAALAAESWLERKWMPLAVGTVSAVIAVRAQGPLRPVTTGPDEAAYLMQAKLLASGHWRAAAAPIPAFFEQMYVFRSPFTAAKYPPGFPLALVPGVRLGVAFLVPGLFAGITAALMFALGRRLAGPWVGLLATILWLTNPHGEAPLQRLMSEHLSTLLVVASWWTLERWRRSARSVDLLLLAVFVGWGAITRPLTMFAVAIPIAVVVIRRIARAGRWRQLASGAAAGTAVLLLLPLWCRQTTGDWRVSPLALHVRWYTPYDALGFGTPPAPLRALPSDLDHVRTTLYRSRLGHRYRDIPRLIVERTVAIAHDAFPGWRVVFLPFLVAALFLGRPEISFAALTAGIDFAAYLTLSHPAHLTKYYLETYPALFFIAAAGVWAMLFRSRSPERPASNERGIRAVAGLSLMVLLVVAGIGGVARFREGWMAEDSVKMRFTDRIGAIPSKAIVFVRYGPAHLAYHSLIENDADLSRERVWIVYDRGADNARLRAVAPDRIPYLYDERSDRLIRIDRPLTSKEKELVGSSGAALTASRIGSPTVRPDTRTIREPGDSWSTTP